MAVGQGQELQRRGYEVTLLGGHDGLGSPPTQVEGLPAQLSPTHRVVPGSGFSGLVASGVTSWLTRQIRENAIDLAHIHSGRHLITLSVARRLRAAGIPYVVQTHGMIPISRRLDARLLDRLGTRDLLGGAAAVLALTAHEEDELSAQFGNSIKIKRLVNGVKMQSLSRAKSNPPEFLFLGRLQERKRPEVLVDAAAILRDRGLRFSVAFVGPDEGRRMSVEARIAHHGLAGNVHLEPPLTHAKVLERIRQANLLVLPSVNEPFPMTLLEAMSVGTAVVCTTSCGLAPLIREYDAGGVVAPDARSLADELARLLVDERLMATRTANAQRLLRERLSVHAVVDDLEAIYREAS